MAKRRREARPEGGHTADAGSPVRRPWLWLSALVVAVGCWVVLGSSTPPPAPAGAPGEEAGIPAGLQALPEAKLGGMACQLAYSGDADRLSRLLVRPFAMPADVAQRTPVHCALAGAGLRCRAQRGTGMHRAAEAGRAGRGQLAALRLLLPRVELAEFCPLVDAVHYRNLPAVSMLSAAMRPDQRAECLAEQNVDRETLLHVAARSHGAGFGRFFLRHLLDPASPWPDREAVLAGLGVRPPGQLPSGSEVALAELDRSLGDWPLPQMLELSSELAGRAGRLETANHHGRTPLLVACRGCRGRAVVRLLEAGANGSAVDRFGRGCGEMLAQCEAPDQALEHWQRHTPPSADVLASLAEARAARTPWRPAILAVEPVAADGGWADKGAALLLAQIKDRAPWLSRAGGVAQMDLSDPEGQCEAG